ncbi:unnamed protein product [Coffea canephora]|uniref:Uncharacterized protein n=1 Tax=Coffea canephora TaxID=49390 RepID=A0A068TTT5_COFCA|nr:unnamed protein product [Coffea canephora]
MCPARSYWSSALSSIRWPEFEFSVPASIFRWAAGIDFSYFTTGWSASTFRWLGFSIVDNAMWTVITVLESVALVTMLCYFFIFCGCTL